MKTNIKYIGLHTSQYITLKEYEELLRDLRIKKMTDTLTLGDRIIAGLLNDSNHRYLELKQEE